MALVPDLYGCMADGASHVEAVQNVQDAVRDWVEVARVLGREIPVVGSAIKRSKERESALIETIKILSESYQGLDGQIEKLFSEIEHIKDLIENQEAWNRFEKLVVPHKGSQFSPLRPC